KAASIAYLKGALEQGLSDVEEGRVYEGARVFNEQLNSEQGPSEVLHTHGKSEEKSFRGSFIHGLNFAPSKRKLRGRVTAYNRFPPHRTPNQHLVVENRRNRTIVPKDCRAGNIR